jgi:hypothetical protein
MGGPSQLAAAAMPSNDERGESVICLFEYPCFTCLSAVLGGVDALQQLEDITTIHSFAAQTGQQYIRQYFFVCFFIKTLSALCLYGSYMDRHAALLHCVLKPLVESQGALWPAADHLHNSCTLACNSDH